MEGCSFAVYHNLVLAQEHRVTADEWLGDGGAADSDIWCQIKADVTNRPFTVRTRSDGKQGGHLLGLFAMLTFALGLRSSIEETVNDLLPNARHYAPDADRHSLYQDLFSIYLRISNTLLPEFSFLKDVIQKHSAISEHGL
jgi:xylulokinase